MLKQKLEEDLKKAVGDLGFENTDIVCTISKNSDFGDYSSNIALQLAKLNSRKPHHSPLEIAKEISENLSNLNYLNNIEIKNPGFINFFIKPEFLINDLEEILETGENFGKSEIEKNKKIQVEFISANPTGPLTLANGRGGALGDTLANVLFWSGAEINREYYVNDTGNQVRLLGESALAAAGKIPQKEDHYKGEYIKDLAEKFLQGDLQGEASQDQNPLELGHKLADYLLEHEIKPAIARLGVKFDEFYSERSIYDRDLIGKTVKLLKEKDLAYENEGAVWFKATKFGDEKDRVLMTSEAGRGQIEPTYFLADIAHHLDDLQKYYDRRINILGADHYNYGVRMQGVMEALRYKDKTEIIFIQFVRLFKGGKEVRMSKRAGNFVTLDELLDLAGKDAVRFFFLMYAPSSHIDFDLDLAKEKSNKNPVYYVQYAFARISNILANSKSDPSAPSITLRTSSLKGRIRNSKLQKLEKKEELEIIKHLGEFPDLIKEIAKTYQVQALPTYALKLADLLNRFYECCPVLQAESGDLKEARLILIKASKIVLGNSLKLMGIEAPLKM